MKPSARMLIRIRKLGLPIPMDARVVSLHSGYIQKRDGAWSWCVRSDAHPVMIGGYLSITELLKKELTANQSRTDITIEPK
jgi:hypothetical protein